MFRPALLSRIGYRAVPFLLLASLGCGGSGDTTSGPITGTVTVGGQPLAGHEVVFFQPKQGTNSSAELGTDGSFKLSESLPVGEYVITVTPPPAVPAEAGKPPTSAPRSPVPIKYRDRTQSPLKADVKSGPNQFTFDIPTTP